MKITKLRKQFTEIVRRPQVALFIDNLPKTAAKLKEKQNKGNEGRVIKLMAQTVFDYLYPKAKKKCLECGTKVAWAQDKGRYREYCSQKCMNASPLTLERRTKTNIERFGNADPNKNKTIQRKKVKIFRKKYGVDNPSQARSVKAKKRKTFKANYGVSHWTQTEEAKAEFSSTNPMYSARSKRNLISTNMEKYGVGCAFQSNTVMAKARKTCLRKYGVENAGAVALGYKRKLCVDKFGTQHSVQGYEPLAIAWLSKKPSVESIVTGSKQLPRIKYKEFTYLPDMLVVRRGVNQLIEVKGSWPLRNSLDKVYAKCKAATKYMKSRGGEFWFYYFTDSLHLIRIKSPTRLQLEALLELR